MITIYVITIYVITQYKKLPHCGKIRAKEAVKIAENRIKHSPLTLINDFLCSFIFI